MTRSRGLGRGGARPGAGRKRKQPKHFTVPNQNSEVSSAAPTVLPPTDVSDEALRLASRATLLDVMQNGASDAARVSAAREAFDRVDGKALPAKPKGEDQQDMADHWGELLTPRASSTTGRAN